MADKIPASDLPKGKATHEKMEVDEKSRGSDQTEGQTPQSSSAASGSAPSAGASESGSGSAQSELAVPGLVVTEKSTEPSQTTPSTKEGVSKKTAQKGLARFWDYTKKKLSPKKPDKLAIVAVDTSESLAASSAETASKPQSKKRKDRGSLVIDDSPDGMETLMTEVPSSQDSIFEGDAAARKDSIASGDTGAHISRLPSLESSSEMELEKEVPEKEETSDLAEPGKDEK